jgi:dihydrofolate reductase
MMKCSVYIAASVDGYIASPDGGVDWLHTAGNADADMGTDDMGFQSYISFVDCMIMGRKCMETISSMDLTPEQWVYGDRHIVVLSKTMSEPPENLRGKVAMYSGSIRELVTELQSRGYKHAYIDGGATITSFINCKLIDEITITRIPVLLGEGIPIFGKIKQRVKLENSSAVVFPNEFVQLKYSVSYS